MKYNEIVFVNDGDNSFFAKFIINRSEMNLSIVEKINFFQNKFLKDSSYIKQIETNKIRKIDKNFINSFFDDKISEIDNKDNDLLSLKTNSLSKLNEKLKLKKEELKKCLTNNEENFIINNKEIISQEMYNLSKDIKNLYDDINFIKSSKIGAKNKLNKLRNLLLKEVEIIREEG